MIRQIPNLHALDAVPCIAQAVEVARRERPDIILMAASIGDQAATCLVSSLRIASPASKIVMIGDRRDGAELLEAIRAGIVGFVEWDYMSAPTLQLCVDAVKGGLMIYMATSAQ